MNATTLIMQILSVATLNTPHAVNKTATNTVSACLLIMNYFNHSLVVVQTCTLMVVQTCTLMGHVGSRH